MSMVVNFLGMIVCKKGIFFFSNCCWRLIVCVEMIICLILVFVLLVCLVFLCSLLFVEELLEFVELGVDVVDLVDVRIVGMRYLKFLLMFVFVLMRRWFCFCKVFVIVFVILICCGWCLYFFNLVVICCFGLRMLFGCNMGELD